ncbi:hypothetical protein RA2_01724 [Roseovarius sp. A-2]|uniref:hypothetical protein n=1 Tax=Roseovarius sp. A-2 TaxID=1570360 RepID=UPI0009B50BE7|nr:hypothetical protein [Roseovarius sp. A-2]GAW34672.1 hypothetical protein RA2_01724 [Roseovarius sp. A-2]
MKKITSCLVTCCFATAAMAHDPVILDVQVEKLGMSWRVDVTLEHPDTGWDHYADGWEVLDSEGNRLGHRVLHHPHVNEQPFTRSLTNLQIPDGTREIFVKAHCSVDGWSGAPVRVELTP